MPSLCLSLFYTHVYVNKTGTSLAPSKHCNAAALKTHPSEVRGGPHDKTDRDTAPSAWRAPFMARGQTMTELTSLWVSRRIRFSSGTSSCLTRMRNLIGSCHIAISHGNFVHNSHYFPMNLSRNRIDVHYRTM
jgi:hypothetical protein